MEFFLRAISIIQHKRFTFENTYVVIYFLEVILLSTLPRIRDNCHIFYIINKNLTLERLGLVYILLCPWYKT